MKLSSRIVTFDTAGRRLRSVLALLLLGCLPAAAETRELRLSTSVAEPLLTSLFAGTQGRINNFGPRRGNSWHVASDAFIQLPAALGGSRLDFDLPERRSEPFVAYLDDINLTSVQVKSEGQSFVFRLNFEDNGPEVRSFCLDNFVCGFVGNPTGQINGLAIEILARPVVESGQLGLRDIQVRTAASINMDCGILDWFCNDTTGIRQVVPRQVDAAIRREFEAGTVRARIAATLNAQLPALGVVNPTAVFFDHGGALPELVIQYADGPAVVRGFTQRGFQGSHFDFDLGRQGLAVGQRLLVSFQIPAGFRVAACPEGPWDSRCRTFRENIEYVGDSLAGGIGWLDVQPSVRLYADANFQGAETEARLGTLTALGPLGDNRLSSLRVPPGVRVTICDHPDGSGQCRSFTSDAAFVGDAMNDLTSYVRVEKIRASRNDGVHSIRVTVETGGDDLRCGGQAFVSLKRRSTGLSGEEPITNQRGLPGGSTHIFTYRLRRATRLGEIEGIQVRHQSGACGEPFAGPDNWDLKRLRVEFIGSESSGILLEASGPPLHRFDESKRIFFAAIQPI